MKLNTKTSAAVVACLFAGSLLFAQKETDVDTEYLSSYEDVVITELAASDQRENKFVALQYLEEAIKEGRTSRDMSAALDQLAGEGVTTQSKTNGRVMNNYPDVRKKACDLLAKIPTKESKNTLVNIAQADNEPMVVTAAIKSLGEIAIDPDEVVDVISFANRYNQALAVPASSMAIEVLNAYEKLAPSIADRSAMMESISKIAADSRYVSVVRNRALELLGKLKNQGMNNSKNR